MMRVMLEQDVRGVQLLSPFADHDKAAQLIDFSGLGDVRVHPTDIDQSYILNVPLYACVEEEKEGHRKSICTSRSFADMITDVRELELRVSDFAAMCARMQCNTRRWSPWNPYRQPPVFLRFSRHARVHRKP